MCQAIKSSFRVMIKLFIVILAVTATLSGCTRRLGYGVLLWSPNEEEIASGSVVSVVSQSDIQDSYLVRLDTDASETSIARWRVRFFETEEEAFSRGAEYEELATVYARSGRNALPMRRAPELKNDNIVYRLREGEVVKLIGREDEQSDLSGLVSYWALRRTYTGMNSLSSTLSIPMRNLLSPALRTRCCSSSWTMCGDRSTSWT